jgi:hypothetical protein
LGRCFFVVLRVPQFVCKTHNCWFRVSDAGIMAQMQAALRERALGSYTITPRVLRLSPEGLLTWDALEYITTQLMQQTAFNTAANGWMQQYLEAATRWIGDLGTWLCGVMLPGSQAGEQDRAALAIVQQFLGRAIDILTSKEVRRQRTLHVNTNRVGDRTASADPSLALMLQVEAGLQRVRALAELDKEMLAQLQLKSNEMQAGLQHIRACLQLMAPLMAGGTSTRVNSDGRAQAGGRTQVSPSPYIVRRAFFALAAEVMRDVCVQSACALRLRAEVMRKIGTDITHRCEPCSIARVR